MEFFFGKKIDPPSEKKLIESVLAKYRAKEATDELRKMIYTELMHMKAAGKISIPFQVVLRKDIFAKHRPFIEIVLDTKV